MKHCIKTHQDSNKKDYCEVQKAQKKKRKTEIRTIGKGPNIDEYSKYPIERDEIQKKISARITNEHGIKINRLRIIANFLNRGDDIIQQ